MSDGIAVTPGTGVTVATKAAGTPGTFVDVAAEVQVIEQGVVVAGVATSRPQTGTPASVAASITSVTLLSASGTRKGFRVYNDSVFALYLKYGTTATTTDFTAKVAGGGYLEEDAYGGRVDGVWDFAGGSARVTGLT